MYYICYKGFLQTIYRKFNSYNRAVQWLRQIGKPELISQINKQITFTDWKLTENQRNIK